jgi:DHA1 family inner membrane transport protein
VVVTASGGYRAPALAGAALSLGGLLVLGLSLALVRRRRA